MGDILGKRAGDAVDAVWWRGRRRTTFNQGVGAGLRANVIDGFLNPWISGFYVLAMVLLCMHLYHGLWSMFQSLGFHLKSKRGAAIFAILIAIGNCSIPIAVMLGLVTR